MADPDKDEAGQEGGSQSAPADQKEPVKKALARKAPAKKGDPADQKAPVSKAGKHSFRARWALICNDKSYAPGDPVELSEADYAELAPTGVLGNG